MASTWGKVLDQASIMLSRQDLEKACIKATRHDNMVPKEKHVRKLVVCTHEGSAVNEKIFFHLGERLLIPDWIVVLKTLEVFHRLFREGNPRFIADLKWKGTVFQLNRFNDQTSGESHAQSVFIRKYSQYLEEKVGVFRALRVEFEKDPNLLKGLTVEESFVRLPKIQKQLDSLINCQTSAEAITNPITALAFEMLLKDSFKLYRGLNDGIITLLESYFTLDRTIAITALEIYRTFQKETSSIIAMYEMAKKKFTLEVPDLKHAPTTLVNSLEDYIRDYDEGSDNSRRHSPAAKPQSSSNGRSPVQHQQPPQQQQQKQQQQQQQQNAPSLIDPFGVSDLYQSPAPVQQAPQQQPNLFDPFGDSQPVFNSQPQQHQQSQFSQMHNQFSQSSLANDPFDTQPNPFVHAQPQPTNNYDQKAQQIKAAYTPTLQPTSPTLSPNPNNNKNNMSPSYPKPNYSLDFSTGPTQQQQQPYNNGQLVLGGFNNNPFNNNVQQQPNAFSNQQQMNSFNQQPSFSNQQTFSNQQAFPNQQGFSNQQAFSNQQQQPVNPFF